MLVALSGCESEPEEADPDGLHDPTHPKELAAAGSGPVVETPEEAKPESEPSDEVDQLPLSFEWSANGFQQAPDRYQWGGGAGDGFAFLDYGVPETDDGMLRVDCDEGKPVWRINILSEFPEGPGTQSFFMEVGESDVPTAEYTAVIVPDEMFPHYAIDMEAGDPMMAAMAKGEWLYLQAGDADSREKVRISLEGLAEPLAAFQAACT